MDSLDEIYERHLKLWKSQDRDYGLKTFVTGAMKDYASQKISDLLIRRDEVENKNQSTRK